MAGRRQPLPTGQTGHGAIGRERLEPLAHVHRAGRIQGRQPGHQAAAHRGIGGRIRGAAIQVRQFQRVRVDRHVPLAGQIPEDAHVVKVAVGHDDRGRTCALPEAGRRRLLDGASRAGQTRVDEHPPTIPRVRDADEGHVDKDQPQIREVVGDLARAVAGRDGGIGDGFGTDGDLVFHKDGRHGVSEPCDPEPPGPIAPDVKNGGLNPPRPKGHAAVPTSPKPPHPGC